MSIFGAAFQLCQEDRIEKRVLRGFAVDPALQRRFEPRGSTVLAMVLGMMSKAHVPCSKHIRAC